MKVIEEKMAKRGDNVTVTLSPLFVIFSSMTFILFSYA